MNHFKREIKGRSGIVLLLLSAVLLWPVMQAVHPEPAFCAVTQAHEQQAAASGHDAGASGDWKEILFKWANFVLLFGALGYFLKRPLQQFLATRSEEIRKALEEARAAKVKAEQELAQVMAKVQQIDQEVAALKSEAMTLAEADRQRILEGAQQEANEIVASAEEEVSLLVKNARKELREYSAELVVRLAEDKIKSEIRPENQEPLFSKFVGSLPSTDRSK